jgi:CcmD family protein
MTMTTTQTTQTTRSTQSLARRLSALAWFAVLFALSPGAALAQDFQKVEGPLRPELPSVPFVAAAYGFIWIAILVYVLAVARGLSKVRKDLAELRKKIDGAGPRP